MKEIYLGRGISLSVLNANQADLPLASSGGKAWQLQLLMALAQHFFILAKAVGEAFAFLWEGAEAPFQLYFLICCCAVCFRIAEFPK